MMRLSTNQATHLLHLFADYTRAEVEHTRASMDEGPDVVFEAAEDAAEKHRALIAYVDSLTIGRVVVGDDQLGRVITQVLEARHQEEQG